MSRLIDADELKKVLIDKLYGNRISKGLWVHEYVPSDEYIRGYNISINNAVQSIRELITEAPTVDAVEVVRCKDCIYHNSKSHNCGHPKMGFGLMNVNENDFCPHGERRTDE